jgi:mevalonate kinase
MPGPWEGEAPAKTILAGEHAVVYGHPAVAIPVQALRASARLTEEAGEKVSLFLGDLGIEATLPALDPVPALRPFARILSAAAAFGAPLRGLALEVSSAIPVGRGLGSSAAVSAACFRALAARAGADLSDAELSALTFEIEKVHHGTPSGVDNATVSHGRPVLFRKGENPQLLPTGAFAFVLSDAGSAPSTREMVERVRGLRDARPAETRDLLERMGRVALRTAEALRGGTPAVLGALLAENHGLLRDLGLSTDRIEGLCAAASSAGAHGAKLTGGGGGGYVVACAPDEGAEAVAEAMQKAGGENTVITRLP